MTVRKLLITGAAGFTGRQAAAYFAAEGAEVTAVVRVAADGGSNPYRFPEGVRTYVCDLTEPAAVARMIEAVEPSEVLHLAGRNSVPESWEMPAVYMETNVMTAVYLLDALRSRPEVPVLIAGSMLKFSPGTGERPEHPYSLSKTLEELVSAAWGTLFGQRVLIAEPCNLIGPGPSTGFCSLLAGYIARSERGEKQPVFRLSSAQARRDFLDVRDAVRAYDHILRMGAAGGVYRVDTGNPRTLGEIASRLLDMTKSGVSVDFGPGAAARGGEGPDAGKREPHNQDRPKPEPQNNPDSANPHDPGSSAALHAASLGWNPRIGLERSLSDILDYYRGGGEGAFK